MKLICAEYNKRGDVAYSVVGDNALLRNNDDFYIPDFAAHLTAEPHLVLRVSKIGKSVGERFAGRYYEEVGVGIRFHAEDLENSLLDKDLSPAMASAFDGSAAISPLVAREENMEDWCLVFRKNEEVLYSGRVGDLPLSPEQQIAAMSRYYMLKIGDFIYCGGLPRFVVQPGDRLRLSLAGRELLDFGVK